MTKKEEFVAEYGRSIDLFGEVTKMVVAVRLPSGATELIINTEDFENKMKYYDTMYDDDLKHNHSKAIEIVGCMFV